MKANGIVVVVNLRTCGAHGVTSVDRRTIFGNPVVLGKMCPECGHVHMRDPQMKAMVCYGRYLIRRLSRELEFSRKVGGLSGDIGCWCAPAPCHADLLALYLNESDRAGSFSAGIRALSKHVARMANDSTRQGELF